MTKRLRNEEESAAAHVSPQRRRSSKWSTRSIWQQLREKEAAGRVYFEKACSVQHSDPIQALSLLRTGIDEYQSHHCRFAIYSIAQKVTYGAEDIQRLEEECACGDASAQFHLGWLLLYGVGGLVTDQQRGYQLICASAAQGHAYALEQKAEDLSLGFGCQVNAEAAASFFLQAAEKGCAFSCHWCGRYYEGREDYVLAALYYERGSLMGYSECTTSGTLLREKQDVCPWGHWQPQLHRFVPDNVHEAMRVWVANVRRLPIPREIGAMIVPYIVTQSGWHSDT